MKRTVVGLILAGLLFSVGGVTTPSAAFDGTGICSTLLQYQSFPNNNGYLSEEMTRQCIVRYVGPRLHVEGFAYSWTYKCATMYAESCDVPVPTSRGIHVHLYYKTTKLLDCHTWNQNAPYKDAHCVKTSTLSQNLRPGLYLRCVVYAHAQIAYAIMSTGTCVSLK